MVKIEVDDQTNFLEGQCDQKTQYKLTPTGGIILSVCGTVFIAIYGVAGPFLLPALRKICIPFVPATSIQLRNVFRALTACGCRKGKLLDIGSGDGRIVCEAARQGFQAYGVELNPWLILYSRMKARSLGLSSRTHFFTADLWKSDLGKYDQLVIFGVEQMMLQLENKIETEVKSSCQIVACRFPLPNWNPVLTMGQGVDTVWLYTKPAIPTKSP